MNRGPQHPNEIVPVLWVDGPDAPQRMEGAVESGTITPAEARLLIEFRENGSLSTVVGDRGLCRDLAEEIDRLWSERPDDLPGCSHGDETLRPLADLPVDATRPGARIHEAQSHSRAARDLYLDPSLHRLAALLLGEPVIAIQSILFEYGSGQALHRDPYYVKTDPPGLLVAAWIALEDIHPDSGPLVYVPGSHHSTANDDVEEARVIFTPRSGEVLFWHPGLLHGGSPVADPHRTRKSYVIHFAARRHHRLIAHTITFGDDEPVRRIVGTRRLMKKGGAVGFANPLSRQGTSWVATLRHRFGI
ncbi:MAG: phytanoyl-CoA dioxygenase family protein [Acidobacteria bacterium]|nr:phytanoyl-CoA dioxygenase family protein [Acidobacteriota bacterium]